MAIKLDENGNIDSSKLERELRSALEYDIQYKQKDNMKKKAVKVAGDYDEFKAMVACAHLKTLTRKEVESLGATKKGWQRTLVADLSSKAQILAQEDSKPSVLGSTTVFDKLSQAVASGKTPKPKSVMDLERDLRRLPNDDQRIRYFKQIGLKRIKNLLKTDCGADLLEQILTCIMLCAEEQRHREASMAEAMAGSPITVAASVTVGAAGISSTASAAIEDDSDCAVMPDIAGSGTPPQAVAVIKCAVDVAPADLVSSTFDDRSQDTDENDVMDTFKWLRALSLSPRFDLAIRLANTELVAKVRDWLHGCSHKDASALCAKYSV